MAPSTRAQSRALARLISEASAAANPQVAAEEFDLNEDVDMDASAGSHNEILDGEEVPESMEDQVSAVSQNETTTQDDLEMVDTDMIDEADIPEIKRVEFMSNKKLWRAGLDATLPPIEALGEIFDDITRRAAEMGFLDFITHLRSRKLRVVTMCSGTESPLLAMEMIGKSLEKLFEQKFEFEHLFSCEIEPFKQAYIERNFRPPTLFRDVNELTADKATTAYGAESKVPQNPDILIAGFSCVDFSNLNTKKKTLEESGESGQTFSAILGYAERHRPPLIVLENVKGAPWAKIQTFWQKIGYLVTYKIVDTKFFYLPQTRERGYMVCIDKSRVGDDPELVQNWSDTFEKFKRQASSPFTSFTLPQDDWRIQRSQSTPSSRQANSTRAAVDWVRYKIRHQDYRRAKGLGHKRPLTNYQDGGICRPPSWTDRDWFSAQVERVWDTIDMNFLRTLRYSGFDSSYKLRIIDLSQGVDRELDQRPWGVLGCITPAGMQYVTTRGGMLSGLESLALQGLPVDRLSLTRESPGELRDLAGNAMSSTVVGAAILSALIVGHGALETQSQPSGFIEQEDDWECPPVLEPRGEYQMIARSVQAEVVPSDRLPTFPAIILALARLSSRLCPCEGQSLVKRQNFFQCVLCGHTACEECCGNPAHDYRPIPNILLKKRHRPFKFADKLKWLLPARVTMTGTPMQVYQSMQLTEGLPNDLWTKFLEGIAPVYGDELRFSTLKRAESWTAIYDGRHSMLHLVIGAQGIQWFLYAKPPPSDPSVSIRREIFLRPVARMRIDDNASSLLEGVWEVSAPLSTKLTLHITGTGHQVPAYEARCGLPGPGFEDKKVWSRVRIQAEDDEMKDLDMDVRGEYDILQNCGTACESLHRRAAKPGLPTLYFFLDPRKLGPPELDCFVFSTSHNRLPDDVTRQIVLELNHGWKQSKQGSEETAVTAFYRKWVQCPDLALEDLDPIAPVISRILLPTTTVDVASATCREWNMPVLAVSVGVAPESAESELPWERGPWKPLDMNSESVLYQFSWLWEKFTNLSPFEGWRKVQSPNYVLCDICAPARPKMIWKVSGESGKERISPCEDPSDAARYEHQFKRRPSPFMAFTRIDDHGIGHLCISLNLKTLIHRTCARLAGRVQENAEVQFFWRLKTTDMDLGGPIIGNLRVTNNTEDPEDSQPPNFSSIQLRPDQLRSLCWIRACESDEQRPFREEEVEEVVLEPLSWRVEAKVIADRVVRGGVLADQVGYGKTALVLAMIDAQHQKDVQEADEPCTGAIPVKATLIVVPDILFEQWQSEVQKFLGSTYKVMTIANCRSLYLKTIEDFQTADIIIAAWPVFSGTAYYGRLEQIAGGPSAPTAKSGRIVDDWFSETLQSIGSNVDVLRAQGPEKFLEEVQRKRAATEIANAYNRYAPSRRLKGRKLPIRTATKTSTTEGNGDNEAAGEADTAKKAEGLQKETATTAGPSIDAPKAANASTTKKAQAGTSKKRKLADTKKESSEAKETKKKAWDDRKDFGIESQDTEMRDVSNTVLHMFRFQRVVIDEFTYLDSSRHVLLATIKARSRWLLSGTPPLNEFWEVNSMARLIDVHLGIDDDDAQAKRLRSEAEIFQSYRKLQTQDWHVRRYGLAQAFLDRFMRQNLAEVPAIPYTTHFHAIKLSALEIALYHELKVYFESCNERVRPGRQNRFINDRSGRINEVFQSSETFEEALIKRCTYLDIRPSWSKASEAIDTLPKVVQRRQEDLADLVNTIQHDLRMAVWLFIDLRRRDYYFSKLEESIKQHDFGDCDVSNQALQMFKNALQAYQADDWNYFWTREDSDDEESSEKEGESSQGGDDEVDEEELEPPRKRAKVSDDHAKDDEPDLQEEDGEVEDEEDRDLPPFPKEVKDREKALRQTATNLRTNIAAWVTGLRALRFMETVLSFQSGVNTPPCSGCGRQHSASGTHNVLGKCGHAICNKCIRAVVKSEECPVNGCRGAVSQAYIINEEYLGKYEAQEPVPSCGGSKLKELVDLLKDETRIPKDDRVLLFVQYDEFMDAATAALKESAIPFVAIGAKETGVRKKIKEFKNEEGSAAVDAKVLILMLGSENAAGVNLQMANHVIFLAQMCAASGYDYEASLTQAIGRAVRFGQQKHVHVWHFLALNTLDVAILQKRFDMVLIRRPNGEFDFVNHDEVQPGDVSGWEQPTFLKKTLSD